MECLYCNNDMELGNLKSDGGSGLSYIPINKKSSIYTTRKKIENNGGIALSGPYITRLHNTNVPCYVCKSCRKIVISY